jgi:hypothetical protein
MRVRAPRFLLPALFCAAQKLGPALRPVNEPSFRFPWGNKASESLDLFGCSAAFYAIPRHSAACPQWPS